jgi:hypothetical protein
MAFPWLRVFDAVVGLRDLSRVVRPPAAPAQAPEPLATMPQSHALEKTLTGVVVAALKEAFARDHERLELERERLEAERQQAERALRAELRRQAIDREIGRLRLLAGLAVVSWLGTLWFSSRLAGGDVGARVALGVGWLCLLSALGAALVAQSHTAAALGRADERHVPGDTGPPTWPAAIAPWLIVAGLAVVAFAVLLA